MKNIHERLNRALEKIREPGFRTDNGKAKEVNYWVFDYEPQDELVVRQWVEYVKEQNRKGTDDFQLVVYDLYDMIVDYLAGKGYLKKCDEFEKINGFEQITKAITAAMRINDNSRSLIVKHIRENTPDNAIVFLTGIGKCFPFLRSHKVLNNLHQEYFSVPVILFFPGTYDGQSLTLFNEIFDNNYYRAFQLVK